MPGTPLPQLRARAGSLTARDLVRELRARGWVEMDRRRGKGSHGMFRKPGRRKIVVPRRPRMGTVLSIIRDIAADEEAERDERI